MKHLPVAGKAVTLLFTAVFLVACSSSDTKEQDAQDAAAQAAAEAAAAQAAADAARQAEIQELQDKVATIGNTFFFDFDSSALTPDSREALDAHVALLQTNDNSVRLDGHTDERGTREYNLALGERRANAVRDYMVVNGVASYRIETVSYGEEKPAAMGSGESNWSQNRRVELK
jgi:peptidoglycan-associated lipoprotein